MALGNWLAGMHGEPPEEAVAVLREALEDGEPLVREHAAWALKPTTALTPPGRPTSLKGGINPARSGHQLGDEPGR